MHRGQRTENYNYNEISNTLNKVVIRRVMNLQLTVLNSIEIIGLETKTTKIL